MKAKLSNWKGKLLSQVGRTVLAKSVLSSIPIYSVSTFKAPISVTNELDKIIRDFWWNHDGEERKLHTIHWDKICQHTYEGGLGLRKMRELNGALLAKQT